MRIIVPPELAGERNDTPLVMDRHNIAHRRRKTKAPQAECGMAGTEVTLAQALAFARGWCPHHACYQPPYVHQGRS